MFYDLLIQQHFKYLAVMYKRFTDISVQQPSTTRTPPAITSGRHVYNNYNNTNSNYDNLII